MFMTAIHVVVHVAVFFVRYITELEHVGDIIVWLPGGTLLMKKFYFVVASKFLASIPGRVFAFVTVRPGIEASKFPAPDPA